MRVEDCKPGVRVECINASIIRDGQRQVPLTLGATYTIQTLWPNYSPTYFCSLEEVGGRWFITRFRPLRDLKEVFKEALASKPAPHFVAPKEKV